jgi:predicted flap endonuclease-1-like 5' DNA nuclease
MFRNWGFLISEMVLLILIAALLGLLIGWLIWGRRGAAASAEAEADAATARQEASTARSTAARLQDELDACNRAREGADQKIQALESAAASAPASPAPIAAPEPASEPAGDPVESDTGGDKDYDGDGVVEGTDEGSKPAALDGPRDGQGDDLKQIKGIGPKLEKLCNSLGFWHFDQIAAWSSDEVAWVDANLTGFKGRVSRDNWVDQAKTLAQGGETEFSNRVKKGDVY